MIKKKSALTTRIKSLLNADTTRRKNQRVLTRSITINKSAMKERLLWYGMPKSIFTKKMNPSRLKSLILALSKGGFSRIEKDFCLKMWS